MNSGITTFSDVLSRSSHDIEHARSRNPPFGQKLHSVVKRILSDSLILTVYFKDEESLHKRIVFKLKKNPNKGEKEQKFNLTESTLTYTLTAHTDLRGGSLLFRENIRSEGEHKIQCPKKFGQIHIRLVSNMSEVKKKMSLAGDEVHTRNIVPNKSCADGYYSRPLQGSIF